MDSRADSVWTLNTPPLHFPSSVSSPRSQFASSLHDHRQNPARGPGGRIHARIRSGHRTHRPVPRRRSTCVVFMHLRHITGLFSGRSVPPAATVPQTDVITFERRTYVQNNDQGPPKTPTRLRWPATSPVAVVDNNSLTFFFSFLSCSPFADGGVQVSVHCSAPIRVRVRLHPTSATWPSRRRAPHILFLLFSMA